jgi:hypothetical protein
MRPCTNGHACPILNFYLTPHRWFLLFGLYIYTLPCASSVSGLVKLLLVLPNIVTLVSGSCGIYHHILLPPHYGRCATTLLVYGQVGGGGAVFLVGTYHRPGMR